MITPPNHSDDELEIEIKSLICDWNSPNHLAVSMDATYKELAAYIEQEVRKARIDEMLALRNYFEPGIHSEYLEVIDKYTNDRLATLRSAKDTEGK